MTDVSKIWLTMTTWKFFARIPCLQWGVNEKYTVL